ncbi:hypothetical protein Ptr902_04944 [Pyrenophora tritici-repentis]|nr:hypothetical protein Ptr902_04944 [Pyrenophora tritici-repentis]
MATKRKYSLEDDHVDAQTPKKRSHQNKQKTVAALYDDDDSDHDGAPKGKRSSQRPAPKSSRATKKAKKSDRLLAELADYNKPPVDRSRRESPDAIADDEEPMSRPKRGSAPKTSMFTRKTADVTEKARKDGGRITKPKSKATRSIRRSQKERMRTEVEQLALWRGWVSDGSSEEDEKNKHLPRTHSNHYPPKNFGVQNVDWSLLPGELRNRIYDYAMMGENEKVINVRHCPDGVPRRSDRGIASNTNFAFSHWGFTQTCRQIRHELKPWLQMKRQVRTPLETINEYIDTFHRPDADGKLIGWVEPICRDVPLSGDGVDVLALLKLKENNPDFHIHFSLTQSNSGHFNEMNIMHDIEDTYTHGWMALFANAGIVGAKVSSVAGDTAVSNVSTEDDADLPQPNDTLLKLKTGPIKAARITNGSIPIETRLKGTGSSEDWYGDLEGEATFGY